MDPVTLFLVQGIAGGVVLALLFLWFERRHGRPPSLAARSSDGITTDPINMARIKVAGVGGLGLVAMAVATALDVPRIGQTLLVGLCLGVVLAIVLITRRRHA
jgi:hypothetical protein